jgi:undecaprenyl-diphosphatase
VAAAGVYGGAGLLHAIVREAMHRARPPAADWLASASGWSYTSGHTTQAGAAWGVMALLLWAYAGPRVGSLGVLAATLITTVVAASRVYLGVHWLTDVLGGATSTLALLALVTFVWLLLPREMGPRR